MLCIVCLFFFSLACSRVYNLHWLWSLGCVLAIQHCLLLDCWVSTLVVYTFLTIQELQVIMCTQMISLCFHRKNLFQKPHNFIHLNLCVALLLGYGLFVGGTDFARHIPVSLLNIYTTKSGNNILPHLIISFISRQ